MPVTVKVNGAANSLVHKGSNGISMATIPDVCKTPTPGGPVPIPYPNISQSAMLAKGTTTVKADGMMVAIKGSEFSLSNGDNAGVAGGVKSSTFMKESTWLLYSFDVKMDGQNACRLTDKKFHNHENTVNMGGVLQPPVVPPPVVIDAKVKAAVLEAEILEVTWLNGLDVARAKAKITAPHWKAGEAAVEDDAPDKKQHYKTGSRKPAAYDLANTAKNAKLKIKLHVIRSEEQPGDGLLAGQLGELQFEGRCPAATGTHEVEVSIKKMPDVAKHFEGNVTWTLTTTASVVSLLPRTRLEVFIVLDKPAPYFTAGVWAEALRFVFKQGAMANVKKPAEVAARVTRLCHTKHGMTYDTLEGAPKFGGSNLGSSAFRLMRYMAKDGAAGNVVNCYDQAAAIQSLAGAMGVTLTWIYLGPYGSIKPTSLVGVGLCNNPFFSSNGSKKLVPWDDPHRTGFGNHAFAQLGTGTLDACAGPHVGNETLREYVEAAVDAKRERIRRPGTWKTDDDYWNALVAQPNPHAGVTGVV